MRLSHLHAFALSAELGSFTAAADRLGISQPSISELIKRLEADVQLELFVRGGRRLVLTAAGQELLPWAQRIDEDVAHAQQALDALRGITGGVATFGVLRNAAFYFLSDLAARFHSERPGVDVRLVGQNSVEVAAAVRSGEIEAGLVVLPVDTDGLEVRPLVRDEVLWASADAARTAQAFQPELIPLRPLILYDAHYGDTDPTRRQLRDLAQRHGIRFHATIEVENVDAALNLVSRGIGDTIVSRAVTNSPTFPSNVFTATFAEPFYDTIALISRDGATLSPVTAELAKLAIRMLRQTNIEHVASPTY